MNAKKMLLTSALLLTLTGCFGGGNTKEEQLKIAAESIKRQDYETAYSVLQPLAEEGDRISQFNLGLLYYNGAGLDKQDFTHAIPWLERAAAQNHLQAQKLLGLIYIKGEGVFQDLDTAREWLAKATAQGDEEAKLVLDDINNGVVFN